MRAFLLLLALACTPTWAINKCIGADGRVTYQEQGCSADAKETQSIKTWENSGYVGTGAARRDVQPNPQLSGPPEATPLLALYRRWADAERLAFSTSRIALAVPAASVQSLQREAEALRPPDCLAAAHKTLVELITKSSEAILQFMGKEEVTGMAYQIVHRPKLIPSFETAVTTARCDASK